MAKRHPTKEPVAPSEESKLLLQTLESGFRRRGRWIGWIVFIGSFLVFATTRSMYNGGDTRAIVDLSWWATEGNPPRLNGHPAYPDNQKTYGYWAFRTPSGIVATKYHHGGPLLFTVPALVFLQWVGVQITADLVSSFTKILASLMTAGAAWCLWRVLVVYFGSLAGFLGALLFSLGSPAYGVLSQGLWTQTGAVLSQGVSMALILVLFHRLKTRPNDPPRRLVFHTALFVGGFFASWAAICRPTFASWTLFLGAVAVFRLRKRSWSFLLGAAVAGGLGLWLLKYSTGRWFGQWGAAKAGEVGAVPPISSMFQAATGFWISPGRGLLVFCPWMIVFFVGLWLFLRKGGLRDPLFWCNFLFCGVVYVAVVTFSSWYAGWSGGPRLQADLLLSGLFVSGPALRAAVRRWYGIAALLILLVPSVWVEHAWAVIQWDHPWEPYAGDLAKSVWKWKDGQLDWYWTQGAIERSLRGETREPLVDKPELDASRPDVMKYVESGIAPVKEKNYFQLAARRASFALTFPEILKGRDMVWVFQVWGSSMGGFSRTLEVRVNGHTLETVHFITGLAKVDVIVKVPGSLLGRTPYDRLVLYEAHPPLIGLGASFAHVGPLLFLAADSPSGRKVLEEEAKKKKRDGPD